MTDAGTDRSPDGLAALVLLLTLLSFARNDVWHDGVILGGEDAAAKHRARGG